jgi:hypothetical protein
MTRTRSRYVVTKFIGMYVAQDTYTKENAAQLHLSEYDAALDAARLNARHAARLAPWQTEAALCFASL